MALCSLKKAQRQLYLTCETKILPFGDKPINFFITCVAVDNVIRTVLNFLRERNYSSSSHCYIKGKGKVVPVL
jgi:hypothetical protein